MLEIVSHERNETMLHLSRDSRKSDTIQHGRHLLPRRSRESKGSYRLQDRYPSQEQQGDSPSSVQFSSSLVTTWYLEAILHRNNQACYLASSFQSCDMYQPFCFAGSQHCHAYSSRLLLAKDSKMWKRFRA
jgi:hypothetical protein